MFAGMQVHARRCKQAAAPGQCPRREIGAPASFAAKVLHGKEYVAATTHPAEQGGMHGIGIAARLPIQRGFQKFGGHFCDVLIQALDGEPNMLFV
jgi:hypothetical protein